jgi:hypothetical protein
VAKGCLHIDVCIRIIELWLTVSYMQLFVDRYITVADVLLHEAVCRQRHELWLTAVYLNLFVERVLKCGQIFFI